MESQHVGSKQIGLISDTAYVGPQSAQSGVDYRKEHVPVGESVVWLARVRGDHGPTAIEVNGRRAGSNACLGNLVDSLPAVKAVPSSGYDSKCGVTAEQSDGLNRGLDLLDGQPVVTIANDGPDPGRTYLRVGKLVSTPWVYGVHTG